MAELPADNNTGDNSIADALQNVIEAAINQYTQDQQRKPKHRHLTSAYDGLLVTVLLINAALLAYILATTDWHNALPLDEAIIASAANVLGAILVRQDYAVNFVYAVVLRIPHALPLRLRSGLVRVYEHGGIHAGCGVAGACWFVLFVAMLTAEFARGRMDGGVPAMAVSYALVVLLATIVVFAQQRLRYRYHDAFELTHRYAGWAAVLLFWGDLLAMTYTGVSKNVGVTKDTAVQPVRLGTALAHAPAFWLLALTTVHLLLPWLRLRRMHFETTVLSPSAVRLDFTAPWPPVTGILLSASPLREWHPFATFPAPSTGGQRRTAADGREQHSVLISRAGDWTAAQIAAPRTTYWVRGAPRAGLLQLALAFRSVVIVTTGAGIGPALSLLLCAAPRRARTACRLVWCAASPRAALGADVCDAVMRADPRAVVVDSRARGGRPDVLALAYGVWHAERAEAVFVISNRALTLAVVEGLRDMGVHAFGPIWDS
jgi:hypothetical protein